MSGMGTKIASVKTALFQSPSGLLPEGRFHAKPQPSRVSSVMSQRIPVFLMPRCHFDLRQRARLVDVALETPTRRLWAISPSNGEGTDQRLSEFHALFFHVRSPLRRTMRKRPCCHAFQGDVIRPRRSPGGLELKRQS